MFRAIRLVSLLITVLPAVVLYSLGNKIAKKVTSQEGPSFWPQEAKADVLGGTPEGGTPPGGNESGCCGCAESGDSGPGSGSGSGSGAGAEAAGAEAAGAEASAY